MSMYEDRRGLVFAMSNAVVNSISVFARDEAGALTFLSSVPTGGAGTGMAMVDPLGSQGALVLSRDKRLLFAVNAGSDTISSFRVHEQGLTPVDQIPSRGIMPVSLTEADGVLYAANAGDDATPANIAGFCVRRSGAMRPMVGGLARLSIDDAAPGCIVFDRSANVLVVSERATNNLVVFALDDTGALDHARVNPSNGPVPFGAAFARSNALLVTEAGVNALSSYHVRRSLGLALISGSVPTGQIAPCWVSVTRDGRFAYTSNAGSGSVTRYAVSNEGALTVLDSVLTTPNGQGAPLDSAIARRFLYVLNGNGGSITAFSIADDGTLTWLAVYTDTNLPLLGAQGIAAL